MMLSPLAGIDVVALRGAAAADTPFFSSTVIGRRQDGALLELARFQGDSVEGVEFMQADIDAAVSGGDATWLPVPIPARARVVAWFAGPSDMADVSGLLCASGVWFEEVPQPVGAAFIVRRPEADVVRQVLCDRHREAGRQAYAAGDTAQALQHADRAWLMAMPVTPADVALLVESTRLERGNDEADSLLQAERNSRDAAFMRMVDRAIDALPTVTRVIPLPLRARQRASVALSLQQQGLAAA